jgi:hypothetical protein
MDNVSTTGCHGIAELLALLDGIRAVAFDRTLADEDIARRVRDLFREHDEKADGPEQLVRAQQRRPAPD